MGKARFLCAGIVAGYLGAGLLLWGCQSRLIFEPETQLRAAPSDFAFPISEVSIPVASPGRLSGWWIPAPRRDAKVVLYLHGNRETVGSSVREIEPLRALGYSVLLIDYRGFGRSEGAFPSEASVYEDADAAWDFLVQARGVLPANLYLYGHSLGGAIAVELARRHPEAAGLIVESGFTSIHDMARLDRRYALLPVGLFLNQRFDSLRKIAGLKLPVLIVHGTADEVVPFAMGRQLYAASGGKASFLAIDGGRHDHDAEAGALAIRGAVRAFVEGRTLTALAH